MLGQRASGLDVGELGFGAAELALGAAHVDDRGDLAGETVLRNPHRLGVGHIGVFQHARLRVQAAEFNVVRREFGVQAEAHRLQIGGTGLGGITAGP